MSTPTQRARHEGSVPGSSDRVGTGSHTSVSQATNIPALHEMTSHGQRVALAYYESGVLAGIEMGRAQAEDEMAALWRQAHAVVQHTAKQPTFEELCQQRVEPERAQQQRDEMRRRGIAA